MDPLLKAFLDYMRYERGASEMTLDGYRGDLMAFESFFKSLDSDLTWQSLDSDVVREWIVSLMEKGQKPASAKRRLSAVKSCFRFLMRRNIVAKNPARNIVAPKAEKPLPTFVREEDMNRLLDNDEAFGQNAKGTRDRLIIEMFYETGLRRAELIGLDLDDVNTEQMTLHVTGKGNKQRIVPFGTALRDLIYKYIGTRASMANPGEKAFFISDRGRRVSVPMVANLVRNKLALVTTQQKRSPHVLRHSFATAMLNNDASLQAVKELLGHERLATTEIYTHTTFGELRRIYNNAHPRA